MPVTRSFSPLSTLPGAGVRSIAAGIEAATGGCPARKDGEEDAEEDDDVWESVTEQPADVTTNATIAAAKRTFIPFAELCHIGIELVSFVTS